MNGWTVVLCSMSLDVDVDLVDVDCQKKVMGDLSGRLRGPDPPRLQ